jgi:heme-degrading monooxygenase HmoA
MSSGGKMNITKTWRLLFISGVCLLLLSVSFTPPSQAAIQGIARVWEGRTTLAKADGFEKYLNQALVPQISSARGNVGMQILRRPTTDAVEFIVITYWDSRESIKKIMGEDIERSVPLPREGEFLIAPVTTVRHYQVVYSK